MCLSVKVSVCVVRVLVSGQGVCFCQHMCVYVSAQVSTIVQTCVLSVRVSLEESGSLCVSLCQCVSRYVPLSHADVTEFVRVSASVTVCQ